MSPAIIARRCSSIFLLLIAATLVAGAQLSIRYSEQAEVLFQQGVKLFSTARLEEANRAFDEIIREYPESHRITAAYVMKGKALFRLGDNLESAKTLKSFLAIFPASSYVPDAELTLGLIYGNIGRQQEALDAFLAAWRATRPPVPPKLMGWIIYALDTTLDAHMPPSTLTWLLDQNYRQAERTYLWLKIGERGVANGNSRDAAIALDTLNRYPAGIFSERIERLRRAIALRAMVKIGVMAPLMRNGSVEVSHDVGSEIVEGILFAADRYLQDPSMRVKIITEVKDTERDPRVAARDVDEFSRDTSVIGILGPVFSATTTSAAAVANDRRIPLLTPTANANGIAAIGKYVFQANPDYEMRGRAMATYAVKTKGFVNLAVLAPGDTYAKQMAEGFAKEAARLGAKIIATAWYQRGTSDLKEQLGTIRRAAMIESGDPFISFSKKVRQSDLMKLVDFGIPVKRIDSLMNKSAQIKASLLLGPDSKARADSLGIGTLPDDSKVDSLEYPVTNIQGIYAPISTPDDIGVISSQIVYFNFQTQILGSGEWNKFSELNANRRYCNGVVFESEAFIDSTTLAYTEFANGFAAKFKKRPTRNTLFGYDSADLMFGLVRDGAMTREALTRSLSMVQDYHGLHARIGFSAGRVNSWFPIMQYVADGILMVDELQVGHDESAKK